MAEDLIKITGDKEAVYKSLLPQIKALVGDESDTVANLSNIAAALNETFSFFWVGFYLVKDDQLVLGPFQGPVACTRITKGRGVCGTAWERKETIVVDDVDLFPGHIACSSLSKSEIVVPILKNGEVIGVLDVDSNKVADFNQTDEFYLTELCQWISDII